MLDLNICKNLYAEGPATRSSWTVYAYNHRALVAPNDPCTNATGHRSAGIAFAPPTDTSYPDEYRGAMFVSDYTRRCIWSVGTDPDGSPDYGNIHTFVAGVAKPVNLAIGPGGDLYYVDLDGTIRRAALHGRREPAAHRPLATADPGRRAHAAERAVRRAADRAIPTARSLTYERDLNGDGLDVRFDRAGADLHLPDSRQRHGRPSRHRSLRPHRRDDGAGVLPGHTTQTGQPDLPPR